MEVLDGTGGERVDRTDRREQTQTTSHELSTEAALFAGGGERPLLCVDVSGFVAPGARMSPILMSRASITVRSNGKRQVLRVPRVSDRAFNP